MNYKNLLLKKVLLLGVITGVYTFDFRRAWAEEIIPEVQEQEIVDGK